MNVLLHGFSDTKESEARECDGGIIFQAATKAKTQMTSKSRRE